MPVTGDRPRNPRPGRVERPWPHRVGGALSLDFGNTVTGAERDEDEYLASYLDLVEWAAEAGVLTARDAAALRRARSTRAADRAFRRAVELRSAVYRVFATIARGADPAAADLAFLTACEAEAVAHSRLVADEGRWVRRWSFVEPHSPLWPIAVSAVDLRGRERRCA